MKQFDHKFTVDSPLDRVSAFHMDPHTLKKLTPLPMSVTVNEKESGSDGMLSDFKIWFGPFPIRWVAVISTDSRIPGFVDRQVIGPFEFWEHRHMFYQIDPQTTQIVDQIAAVPGKKLIGGLVSWLMWLTLPVLFAYRTWRTRRELDKVRA